MIIKCIANNISRLPQSLQKYALTQNESGILDISVGKHYAVYGKELIKGRWKYLVHTDTENIESFWWLPSDFFEVVDDSEPKGWKEIVKGLFSYPCLGKWQVSEGLIDNEADAIAEFNAEVSRDPTFPDQKVLDKLNRSFYANKHRQREKRTDELAEERGWDKGLYIEGEDDRR